MPTTTAPTPQTQASAAAQAITNFLAVAPRKYTAILGTVAAGNAGGNTATVVWQQQIPIVPAYCTAIDYEITLPVTVTLGIGNVTTATMTASPWAPYSAVGNQVTLGGAPPWPLTEFTPWYMDMITHKINYDPAYSGLGGGAIAPFAGMDQGPLPTQISTASGALTPGATITNVTAGVTNTTYVYQFKLRQQLQRKRHLLWGALPFGDPQNRPNNITQILPLLGTLPEQSMFVANGGVGGGNTNAVVVAAAGASVIASYELAYIDLLPAGMTVTPQPTVGYALQMVQFSTAGINSGTINPITHRTSMLYTAIHQLLINAQLPIRADYYGLWDDQDQQSARWAFDAQVNTFQHWFSFVQRIYQRYFPTGFYFANLEGGDMPDLPSVTPYDALMSPDQTYATSFGVPTTPAMTTSLRIPQGTGAVNPYIRTYSLGLVRVPY
jgi:hypothetical protein